MSMPPLPHVPRVGRPPKQYTAVDMRAYGIACHNAALKRAIELCDSVWKGYDREFQGEAQETVGDCVALIEKEML